MKTIITIALLVLSSATMAQAKTITIIGNGYCKKGFNVIPPAGTGSCARQEAENDSIEKCSYAGGYVVSTKTTNTNCDLRIVAGAYIDTVYARVCQSRALTVCQIEN